MTFVPQVYRSYAGESAREDPGYCPVCGSSCQLAPVAGRTRAVCSACGAVRYRNPLPGVAVVVRREQFVLLVHHRRTGVCAESWGVPAGFVEYDEDFLSAAHRETWEETGLQIELTGLASLSSNFHREGLHAVVGVVCARPVGGVLRPGDDVDDVRWVPLRGPYPELAFAGDRSALMAMAEGRLPTLSIDPRFRRRPR